jgi:hypothetical protein
VKKFPSKEFVACRGLRFCYSNLSKENIFI